MIRCDGDTVFSTNNEVLLRNTRQLPAINCVQYTCDKQIVTEEMLQLANMNGFGNEVGTVTNRVTSMFDILAQYEEGSKEYEELMYRIIVSQHYQQLAIDKVKGIVAEPMPTSWYQLRDCDNDFDKSIVCESKPYFMKHIYSQVDTEVKNHDELFSCKSLCRVGKTLQELLETPNEELTEEQRDFLSCYHSRLPILNNNCTMNRICRYMEKQLSVKVSECSSIPFDFTILKTDKKTPKDTQQSIEELYAEYKKRMTELMQTSSTIRLDKEDVKNCSQMFKRTFTNKAKEVCKDEEVLCNILVDLCYGSTGRKKGSKQFAWDICRKQLIKNLENNRGY